MSYYKTGRIYRIVCLPNPNIQYVGSTFDTLRNRWQSHKTSNQTTSINKYFDEYGIDNFKILIIKEYQVVDRKHLIAYEQLHINNIKCVNEKASFRIPAVYKIRRKQLNKEYHEKNKEQLKNYRKQYRKDNEEEIKKRKKDYYERNKQEINEKRRIQYKQLKK